ncbi:amino acid ABC transporter permease [Laceyella putida]|uniref:Amino acid ABC transporter permease n=1 Tax=Laceyella putida TaxID=110101 RepID=A0ABW2RNQ3_9BACL
MVERSGVKVDFSFLESYGEEFYDGLWTTISVSLLALIFSLILGTVIAVFRISGVRLLEGFGTAYVEFIRNTPLVAQIFFVFFALPAVGIKFSQFMVGTIGLSIYTSSYIAEVIRAGIQSVPRGQMEAARSSGLTYIQAMTHVILPQAFKLIIPPLGNQFINLVKNSSVLAVIAGGELMYFTDQATTESDVTPVYLFVAVVYLVLTIPLSLLVNYLERRWMKKEAR